ncbi:hypothetical protein [Streptomyces sp. S.PNR 29]|uniref:hypothetical protein n=1 Tax=Streptomyces sp. S.PNR 29 TaxID=2973805 RepID=UPI0025B1446B|nr:hypothetical protein [Streptomyces sp. S.PNR 29]MDN0196803.1 hypothetical protein [Streptomyces sp. S.PNR 29]
MEEAPGELVPALEHLSATLREVEDPGTSPQDRQEVLSSTHEVIALLEKIDDPGTPRELRRQLTELVQQTTSTLEMGQDPEVPPEERRMITWVTQQTARVFPLFGDPNTPQDQQEQLAGTANRMLTALAEGHDKKEVAKVARDMGAAMNQIGDPDTPKRERKGLAKSTHQVGESLEKLSDPSSSTEEKAEARKALEKEVARMQEEQKKAASAQNLPDVSLGKAAEVCTSAAFSMVPERALNWGLSILLPERWDTEGVKDFWIATEQGNESLKVTAQLQNDEYANAPFETARLVTQLAELLPADRLVETIGNPSLYCLQSAWRLHEELGIRAGTWLQLAMEKKDGGP